MKVCTFNVNSIKARLDLLLAWLQKRGIDIDILCLQEIKTEDIGFPYEMLQRLGYQCHINGQKGYNGVAICTKIPPTEVILDFQDTTLNEQKRLIIAKINNFNIINLYAPHGDERGNDKYFFKLKWYDAFYNYLVSNPTGVSRTILLGDFNVAVDDIDVYNPVLLKDTIGTMPEEISAFNKILSLGFIDCFRMLYPDKKAFTWWSYLGGAFWKDEGMRVDYILCSRDASASVTSVEIDVWTRKRRDPKPSDHAPVIAEFA